MNTFRILSMASSLALITACGSGGSGDDPATGVLSLGITDGPVDGVSQIWIEFDGITLKPANGPQQEFRFDTPKTFDLKSLNNGKTELLFDQAVAAGQYNWIKIDVNADFDGAMDSYVIEDDGGQVELRVPPDRLKLGNHFVITQGGTTSLVIEWNLRMGLSNPVGQTGYKLQPSLRVTDMTEHGTIAGTVAIDQLPGPCSSDPNTGEGNVAYVYEGFDITPDDIDGESAEPLTTADIRLDPDSGNQAYRIAFLSPGEYTVAFTCQATEDIAPDADQPSLPVDEPILFTPGFNVTVANGAVEVLNFPGN